jgi:cyclic di-GMP phosphodiesterase
MLRLPSAFSALMGTIARPRAAQRRLERHLALAYEVAVDFQATAGFDGHFKRVNPAGCALLGYTEEELMAKPFVEFVHPDDRERTAAEAGQIADREGATVDFENRYLTGDGSYRWLAWRSVASDGVIYASARDVTATKEQSDALETLVRERTRDLEAASFENLRRLALAAEYRDDDTHRHTERVGALAAMLAEELRLPAELVQRIRHAAPLHDVGKIGLPDAILLKRGRLTEQERALMQTHTTIGANILADSQFPVLRLGHEIALTHHERWDGAGYPSRLAGDDISRPGRITAVADVFDALTHARPYKPAWGLEQAVTEIVAGAGSQFDPAVVVAFEALHRRGALEAFTVNAADLLAAAPSTSSAAA